MYTRSMTAYNCKATAIWMYKYCNTQLVSMIHVLYSIIVWAHDVSGPVGVK
jgi:hypothetical protein